MTPDDMIEVQDRSITIGPFRLVLWRFPKMGEWGVMASFVVRKVGVSVQVSRERWAL